jgi:hypothetical protein
LARIIGADYWLQACDTTIPNLPCKPTSEIARTGAGEHVLDVWRSRNALSDETGVLPIKTEAITNASIAVVRIRPSPCTKRISPAGLSPKLVNRWLPAPRRGSTKTLFLLYFY